MGNIFRKKKKEASNEAPNEAAETPGSSPETSASSGGFVEDLLKAMNNYRSKHNAPPLQLNEDLNKGAKQWAEKIASKGALEHASNRDGCGENLAWSSGEMTGQEVAKMWYDEIENYNFNNPGFSSNTGHFTQVVWRASTEFGGAKVSTDNKGTFVVGRFRVAGNINTEEEFRENVLPAK